MEECLLCNENKSGIWIKKFECWNLGVCPNQHTLASLVVILKEHKELFSEMKENELSELLKIVKTGEKILNTEFKPDWFNVQQNGNWHHHLHIHIIPRYKETKLYENREFSDKTFGQPVQYTSEIEKEEFLQKLTQILKKCL